MERRILTIVVSVVVAAVVFLVVYNFLSDDQEASEALSADRSVANASVGTEEALLVPNSEAYSNLFRVEVSQAGGALSSFQLLRNQFRQSDRTDGAKAYIPESRLVEGPYEVVGPWSPAYYPFQLEFRQLDWDQEGMQLRRVVRTETSAIWSEDGLQVVLGEPVSGDLRLQPGDILVSKDFSAPISAVTDDGAAAFAVAPAKRPRRVTIIRSGTPLAQYQSDATFTKVESGDPNVVALVWPNPGRDTSDVYIERRWSITDTYRLRHELRFINLASQSLNAKYKIVVNGWVDPFAEPPGMFSPPIQDWAPTCFVDGSHEEETLQDLVDEGGQMAFPGSTSWFGVNSQFFLMAAVFDKAAGIQGTCSLQANSQGVIGAVFGRNTEDVIPGASSVCEPDWLAHHTNNLSCAAAMTAMGVDASHLDEASLERALDAFVGPREKATRYKVMLSAYREAQSEGRLAFSVYAGPKDLDLLEALTPTLDNTLDFWFVGALAKPMLWFLKFLYDLVSIWWFAIFLLTVTIRMAMLPLTQKSYVQMQKMKELKPEIDVIQKKYGNDKQRLQAEMMNVYKRHNMNPLGGCFPMLLQMPLYFALYRCLYAAVDLYQAPLFGWITDMTQPDPYYVLPALLGVFMFVQQQLMPSAGGDEMQQKIIKYVMPIMFSVFMFMLPSGLVFYIFVSTVISVGQQWWIKKQFENSKASARSKAA